MCQLHGMQYSFKLNYIRINLHPTPPPRKVSHSGGQASKTLKVLGSIAFIGPNYRNEPPSSIIVLFFASPILYFSLSLGGGSGGMPAAKILWTIVVYPSKNCLAIPDGPFPSAAGRKGILLHKENKGGGLLVFCMSSGLTGI